MTIRKTRAKTIATAVEVPQTREAVVAAIAKIGTLQRERSRIEAAMNDALAAVRQSHEERAQPLAEEVKALTEGVRVWCEANRHALTDGGRTKTAALASGEVRWRMTPGRVVIRSAETVMATLRSLGLQRFIRVKEEPNKEAMLAEPAVAAAVAGVSIVQGEEFEVLPFETALAEAGLAGSGARGAMTAEAVS
jgi:phage host-nuclease inhibitor protein Gam